MTTTLVAFAVALVLALGAPMLLSRGGWWIRRPLLALSAWVAAIVGGAGAIGVGVAAWILPTPMWERPGCGGCGPAGAFLLGCGGALALGALVAFVGGQAERLWTEERAMDPSVLMLAAASTRSRVEPDGIRVSFIEADAPVAFSSRSCGRQILISTGLEGQLTTAQLRSVIEHERAHLRCRHDRLVMLARLNAACFPRLLGARVFETRVHLMVELMADDRAARACGVEDTAGALSRLAAVTSEESTVLRASRLERVARRRTLLAA